MPDPTELVLTGAFAAAITVFVLAALMRAWKHHGQLPPNADPKIEEIPAGQAPTMTAADPYQSPGSTAAAPDRGGQIGRVVLSPYLPIDLLGAALIFLVFAGLVLTSFQSQEKPGTALNAQTLLINIGFQFLMAGLVTAIVIRRVRFRSWLGLHWPAWPWAFLLGPASLLFMWLILTGLKITGYIGWMESLGVETTQDTVKLLQESDEPRLLGLMAFAAVIAAPLCEEIVFRGYFYPVLKKFGGILPAAICSALVFAAAHGNLTALLPLFIFGGVLVFLYEKTGSIWAPIAAHFCFNGSTVALQLAARYLEIPLGSLW